MTDRDAMIEANFDAFERLQSKFKKKDKGKYALMRDQKLVGVFATAHLAHKYALETYDDKNYSFQEIGCEPIEVITFPALSA